MRKKNVGSGVGKSKVMMYSMYGNGGRIHVILNGKPLEEVDCFKYLGWGRKWQLMEDVKGVWTCGAQN